METKKLGIGTEIVIGTALFIFIAYGMYLKNFVGADAFLKYVTEDGPVEYLTAFFLFFSSLVCLYRVFQYRKMKKPLWILTWAALAFLFFFAAGEEISWGQRIFGVESSDFFLQHNKQGETNLHNLVVEGHNLNILIFSRLMFVVLFIYFALSRLMVWKIPFIRNLVNRFNVPLPGIQHIIIMFSSTLFILLIHIIKESELHELSFAVVFFMIFLNPARIKNE
jgi:hypothetical protein